MPAKVMEMKIHLMVTKYRASVIHHKLPSLHHHLPMERKCNLHKDYRDISPNLPMLILQLPIEVVIIVMCVEDRLQQL